MQTQTDAELLRDYAATGSEAAFGEIVRRYADVVYSAALRQVGQAEHARDVAQIVFADLARKAGHVPANTVLVGWLHRGARLAALEQLRKDRRREHRERQAMNWHESNPSDDWTAVRPMLDEAIASLADEERNALLLRFFKNESLASVGTTLGVSEDAAQKRVSRALGRLREFLAGRGIHTTAATLSLALTTNAVQSAPAGLAGTLTTGAMAATAASAWLILGHLKFAVPILALVAGLAGLTVAHFNLQRKLSDAGALVQQQNADLDALRAGREELLTRSNELEQTRRDAADVLRLRGEVARLRSELADSRAAASPNTLTNRPRQSAARQVLIRSKIFTVPAEELSSVGDNTVLLLNEAQIKALKSPGLKSVGEPQINTVCGGRVRTSITDAVPLIRLPIGSGVTYTNIGITLDITPLCKQDSGVFDLKFTATLNGLVNPSAEDSPPGAWPTEVLQEFCISNQMTVAVGQSIALRQKIPDGHWGQSLTSEGPHSILVIITPIPVDPAGNRVTGVASAAGSTAAASSTEAPPRPAEPPPPP